MTDERRLDLRVGAFVLITAIMLAIGLFAMGTGGRFIRERYALVARFPDVAGLTGGAPVRLAGMLVGTVTRVTFPEDLNARLIEVELAIDEAVQSRIREDSVASIQTVGLLGDKYVELTIGTPARPMLAPGAQVATVSPPNLYAWMQKGEAVLDEGARVVHSLNLVLAALGQSEVFDQLALTSRSVNALVQRIDQGEGLLKALLDDRQGGQLLRDLSQAAKVLHRIAHQAEREQLVLKASRSLTSVAEVTKQVRQGDGLAHATLYTSTMWDPDCARRLAPADVSDFHAAYFAAVAPALAQAVKPWVRPLRRLVWLRTLTWCVRWRVLSRRADGWSKERLAPDHAEHIERTVADYVDADRIAAIRAGLDAKGELFRS